MADNFWLDNPDLRLRMDRAGLEKVVALKERDYATAAKFPHAPRSYADAKDNWALVLDILGDICGRVIAPRSAEADEEGATYRAGEVKYAEATEAAIEAFRKSEILGAMLPWEFGGLNLPETVYTAMVEMVSRAEGGLMTIFGLQEIASTINEFGDEETKARILPRFSRGEVFGAMVLTEPDAGSDLGSVQTRASLDEATGTWKINGVKRFITNGNAQIHLVLARSEEGTKDARGLSMFLVERDKTVKIRRIENKLGIHSSPTCEIQYNDSPAVLVGKRRFGLMRCAMSLMNGARLAVAAQAIGIAEAAYREALRYASERAQFGSTIDKLPALSRILVSMKCELEAARALVFETSVHVDLLKASEYAQELLEKEGKPVPPELIAQKKRASNLADILTPLSKFVATEMGNRVCYEALQIHGGVGYMREFNVERHYRDVRITNIYEGTSQLQVVAALGKTLGRGLDVLFEEWKAVPCDAALDEVRKPLLELTELFGKACDALKPREREAIDYFGADLVGMAGLVVTTWLLLLDARDPGAEGASRKAEVVRAYAAEQLPKARALGEAVLAGTMTAETRREAILA